MQSADARKSRSRVVWGSLLASGLLLVLAGCGTTATPATPAPQQGTSGTPVNLNVGYFPSWEGGLSGVIVKKEGLWKKFLPAGSTVHWDTQVVGPPLVANLLANKDQLAYIGDLPAYVATAKRSIADLRIVENNLFSPTGQMCSILVVRANAPHFSNYQQAVRWLNGKNIGVSGKGSCGDRFVTSIMKKEHIHANVEYLDPTIILTELKSGKIDAAQTFEPHVAQIVAQGVGRVVATGNDFNEHDGDFIVMRKDFITQHPAAALGWVEADLTARHFSRQHPYRTVRDLATQLPGYTPKELWMAIYGRLPAASGASNVNTVAQGTFTTPAVENFTQKSFQFLYSEKILPISRPLPGAMYPNLVQEAAKKLGITLPLGPLPSYPLSAFNPAKAGS